MVGDVRGGTGVAAAAGAGGELAAAEAALEFPGAVPADPSAHVLGAQVIMRITSSAHTRLPTVERPARCPILDFISLPLNLLDRQV
jgi:hypothetical protein